MPASFSPPDERPVSLPYCEGTVRDKGTLALTGPFIGKSLRFFGGLVGPLDKRKARRLRGPGIAQNRKAFLWGMDWTLSSPCPNLICGVMRNVDQNKSRSRTGV
jgi:hypothetical protein